MAICKHKYIFKYDDSYWCFDGRNSLRYYKADYYYCEKCLDEKVVEKNHFCSDGERWNAPEWTKTITRKAAGYQ